MGLLPHGLDDPALRPLTGRLARLPGSESTHHITILPSAARALAAKAVAFDPVKPVQPGRGASPPRLIDACGSRFVVAGRNEARPFAAAPARPAALGCTRVPIQSGGRSLRTLSRLWQLSDLFLPTSPSCESVNHPVRLALLPSPYHRHACCTRPSERLRRRRACSSSPSLRSSPCSTTN